MKNKFEWQRTAVADLCKIQAERFGSISMGNPAKTIRFLSVLGGVLGATVCILMAFLTNATVAARILWVLLALVCLVIIYPVYQLGTVMEALMAQEEKLRLLAARQAKLAGNDAINRYSPLTKNPAARTGAGNSASVSIPNTAEKTIRYAVPDAPTPAPKKETGDLTREFSSSAERGTLNAETGEVNIVDAMQDTTLYPKQTVMTVGTDTFEVNRKYKAVTRFVPMVAIRTIAAGGLHSLAVRRSGYIAAAGYNAYNQCSVSAWRDMVSIVAGNHHTVGLKANGTCVACGYTGYGQCDVEDWQNVCSLAAGTSHTVGLLENGTCVACGDNTYGQCNVFDWTDIIAISANTNYTVGLRVDGTLVAVGANTDGAWSAIKWGGITSIAAGGLHTIGLRSDGTCVSVGNNANGQCEVSRWTKIKAISAGNFHTVGLREDGTCIAVGHNGYGQCNVSEWRDIIAIAAGRNHTLALDRGGRVFAVGDNTYEQCNVKDFDDIKTTGV